MECMGEVLRGSWGASCWCMYPRLSSAASNLGNRGRREAMTELARRRRAPGLLAFEGDEPVGWIAIAPRKELKRVDASRATPRVDLWMFGSFPASLCAPGRAAAGSP